MLGVKKSRKGVALLTLLMMLVTTFVPTGAYAATNSADEYIYKYIGTDSNNKGGSISYKENGKTSSGSTIMFKLRKDGSSTIDLAYCCDLDTYTKDNTYYKRTNIENAGYFEEDIAKKIRNVVVNGYDPNNSSSLNNLKNAANTWAKANNKSTISSLSKTQAITATQLAIWTLANAYMSPSSSDKTVTLVRDYLVSLPEVVAGPTDRVVETIGLTAEILKDDNSSEATVTGGFTLYAGAIGSEDKVTPVGSNLALNIKAGSRTIYSGELSEMMDSGLVTLNAETLEYKYTIEGVAASYVKDGVNISINFTGTQTLPKGAYFYKTPNRGDSQNFVGLAEWSKAINVSASAAAKLIKTGKTDISVTKVWEDADNQDGLRPASVQVQLLANGEANGEAVVLDAYNNWSYEWTDLEKYDNGNAITYRIKEVNVPDGYVSEITGSVAAGFVITNSYVPKTTAVSVSKVWEDANNQDGLRPASVEVQLYANGEAKGEAVVLDTENDWSYEWDGLAKNKGGEAVSYTVKELNVPAGYEVNVTGSAAAGFVITNSHTPAKTAVSVVKEWNDANDQDNLRPDRVTVQLQADGKAKGDIVVLDAENNWKYEWTNLDKNKSGKEITYTVEEVNVPTGYKAAVTGSAAAGFVITNSYVPAVTSVKVTKAWDDANNQDGLRPAGIEVQLYANGEISGGTVVLDKNNNWTYTWTDLAKNEAGEAIAYTVKEVDVPEGYESVITGSAAAGFVITNSHTPAKIDVSVVKEWNDANDQDGIRPDSVKVQLKADGEAKGDVVVLNAENNWSHTWAGLAGKASGQEIIYTVEEIDVPEGYEAAVTGSAAEGFVITNSHTPAVTSINVTKVWSDADDQDGIRPNSVKVQLLADGEAKGKIVVLDADNGWTYEWDKLAEKSAGKFIAYTVEEVEIPEGYEAAVTGNAADGYIITNTHVPAVTEVSVAKVWDDNGDQDGIRPDSITVQLLADGKSEGEAVTLSKDNNWKYTWKDLAEKTEGIAINYRVVESEVPEGYTAEITGSAAEGFVITNTHEIATTKMTVAKVWDDNGDQDGIRPDSVKVQLKADGKAYGEAVVLNVENNWTYTWDNIVKKNNGENISYTVDETAVPEGYTKKVSKEGNNVVIINSHTPAVTTIKVTKAWKDANDQDGIRPDSIKVQLKADGEAFGAEITLSAENNWTYTWEDLAKKQAGEAVSYTVTETSAVDGYTSAITGSAAEGYTITNTHTPDTIDIEIEKLWEDLNNVEGLRADEVKITLKADGEEISSIPVSDINEWTDDWNDLPKYDNGKEIDYSITVEGVPEGYETEEIEKTTTEDGKIKFTVKSKYVPKTNVAVTKTWEDSNDQDGIRPESVSVQLLANGEACGDPIMLNEEAGWTYTWENLTKYSDGNAQAELIEYTIAEVDVPEGYVSEITGDAVAGFVITNTHTPETTEVDVIKVWNDANDQDGIRPESIKVQLLANGKASGEAVTISENDDWTYTWEGLVKYEAGEEVAYTIAEVNTPEGYEAAVTGNAADGYIITNTHVPAVTEVSVAKVWDDNDDQDGIRPAAIEVQLKAGRSDSGRVVVLSADNDWTYTWTELAKYEAGEEIAYTVEEAGKIDGYKAETTGDAITGYTITNTHEPERTEIEVTKVWDDADDQDGIRPESVDVELLADGESLGVVTTLSEDNNWSHVWENLDKYADGEEVVYTVAEIEVPEGYTSEITGSMAAGYTVKNTHAPETIDVEIEKIWEDLNNAEGIRAEEVQITLKADGEEVSSIPVSDINEWNDDWDDLPKYDNGKEIEYSITVDGIPEEYETEDIVTTVTDDGKIKFTVKSKYVPRTNISVDKVWDDADDQDGLRPENVQVQLFVDGEAYGAPVVLDEKGGWTYTWENLIKYRDGSSQVELVKYTVEEINEPEGYTARITGNAEEGYTITNTHIPEDIDMFVLKQWIDNSNQEGIRPENVKIQLYGDKEKIGQPLALSDVNEWNDEWTDLPKNEEGEEIDYTIDVNGVPDEYSTDITEITENEEDGFIVVSEYEPTVELSVEKVWNDDDDKDKIRPENIEVQLYADGEAVGSPVKIGASEDWKYTWTELEKYDETEKRIEYTVDEVEVPEGYNKTITGNAEEGFTITNTHAVKAIVIDDSVDTGDDSCMLMWAMMMLTSLLIMILIFMMSRRRNSKQA